MSIEEAILHCRENAEKERADCNYGCAEEHEQLAKWLEELKKNQRRRPDMKKDNEKKTVKISWKVRKVVNSSRINRMYCFKSCEFNQN